MHSDEFRKYMKVIDDNSGEDLGQWDRLVKKMFNDDDSYVTKEDTSHGPKYRVYARFYPRAILGLKGEDFEIEKAVEKAKAAIEQFKNPKKKPVTYDEGW